ncbi:hypothetical protein L6452_36328 [Arctium lappa]|uniref:Uncharacterized protein n=1 Tax=Arctium lappa TaxID=4217 RepID=A0ACB8Y916_ARCLA|nr:hypothetical protein L6452_36328 [Arctium lappa]
MHMHTSANHSISSQQAIVSTFHGELAHTLSSFHSEMAGIVTRTQLPPSLTSFSAPLSLEPIVTSIFLPRIQPIISAITGRLSDPVGTSVVDPQSGLRGSGGSPVIANIMPTLSTGHTSVSSTVVLMGSLSSPGVTLPEFVSREFLNDALKVIETSLSQKFESEMIKASEKFEQQSQPIVSQVPVDYVTESQINQFKDSVEKHLQDLTTAVQLSCKAQSDAVLKKRHDRDSDQDHEGEMNKRLKTAEDTVIITVEEQGTEVAEIIHGEQSENEQMEENVPEAEVEWMIYDNTESMVEKPAIATVEEVMQMLGVNSDNFVNLDDYESDDHEQAAARYDSYWKVKEEGMNVIEHNIESDGPDPENSVTVEEFVQNSIAQGNLSQGENVLDDLFGETLDENFDDLEDEEFLDLDQTFPVQQAKVVEVAQFAGTIGYTPPSYRLFDEDEILTAIPIVSPTRNFFVPETIDTSEPRVSLPLPKDFDSEQPADQPKQKPKIDKPRKSKRSRIPTPKPKPKDLEEERPIIIDIQDFRNKLYKERKQREKEERQIIREAKAELRKEEEEAARAKESALPYIRNPDSPKILSAVETSIQLKPNPVFVTPMEVEEFSKSHGPELETMQAEELFTYEISNLGKVTFKGDVRVGAIPYTGYDVEGDSLKFIEIIRRSLKVPFLEESTKIVVSSLQPVDEACFYGVGDRDKFTVQRKDMKISTFSEADFDNLNISDIMFIVNEFRDRRNRRRSQAVAYALDAIKRFMTRSVYNAYSFDFHLGIETNQNRVNLLTPNFNHPKIRILEPFQVSKYPELGVMYVNTKTHKKQFMRASELAKYSDGTLKYVRKVLEDKLFLSEHERFRKNEAVRTVESLNMEAMLEEINKKIDFREYIRRFEAYLGIRRICFRRWDQSKIVK